MIQILPRYIRHQFIKLFLFSLTGVIIVFLVVDLVENLDRFIDKEVPSNIIVSFYLCYLPYIVVLTMPIATLMGAIFSIGVLARHNEMVAMKSLGYSLYRMMATLLTMGLLVSILSFILAEGIVTSTNRKKEEIKRNTIDKVQGRVSSRLRNLEIQEPPDKIITIGYFEGKKKIARQVKVETFKGHRLISRLDAPSMQWDGDVWIVEKGYKRIFEKETEKAYPINEPLKFHFQFTPKELLLIQIKPDEMNFFELYRFVERIKQTGGEIHRWMTDLYLRITFPFSNFIIILFSVPLAYNRRKKSLTIGFGISLLVCFLYFGLVKMGQTLGQNGSIPPFLAAWLGNGIMGLCGVINLVKVRK